MSDRRHGGRLKGAQGVVAGAAVAVLLVLVPPAGAGTGPTVTLRPTSGPVGTEFLAVGSGFPTCNSFTVRWDSPSTTFSGDAGTATATGVVPADASVSGRTVAALCEAPGFDDVSVEIVTATTTFTVTSAPTTTTTSPTTTTTSRTTTTSGSATTRDGTATTLPPVTTVPSDGVPVALVVAAVVAALLAAALAVLAYRRHSGAAAELDALSTSGAGPVTTPSDVADRLLGAERAAALALAGPASMRMSDAFGGAEVATPLIATLLWEAFVTDPRFGAVLRAAGASDRARRDGELLIVRHADGTRHDLMVLDPGFDSPQPVAMAADLRQSAETAGRRSQELSWSGLLEDEVEGPWRSVDAEMVSSALVEAAATGQFGIIVAAPPRRLLTQVPSPAWAVAIGADPEPVATVGAVVQTQEGVPAVTTVLHAVGDDPEVAVQGRPSRVLSVHEPTDSCVIEAGSLALDGPPRGRAGPLRGVSPRQYEQVTFDGIASGAKATTVTSWDLSILAVQQRVGSKVYTSPDTLLGDSGAALVDSADQIIGFAVYRSGYGEPIEYSAWVWADQVFSAHALRRPGA